MGVVTIEIDKETKSHLHVDIHVDIERKIRLGDQVFWLDCVNDRPGANSCCPSDWGTKGIHIRCCSGIVEAVDEDSASIRQHMRYDDWFWRLFIPRERVIIPKVRLVKSRIILMHILSQSLELAQSEIIVKEM